MLTKQSDVKHRQVVVTAMKFPNSWYNHSKQCVGIFQRNLLCSVVKSLLVFAYRSIFFFFLQLNTIAAYSIVTSMTVLSMTLNYI